MQFSKPGFRPVPLAYKILSIVLIVSFVFIGLVGLILPIIPGIPFLLLALYPLTRVSRRISAIVHKHPWFNRGGAGIPSPLDLNVDLLSNPAKYMDQNGTVIIHVPAG